MPKRLRHVNGTKERPRGRECLRFRFANGPDIVDRVHPDDRAEMFARLWGHHGKGNVWVEHRRLGRQEQYAMLNLPKEAA